MTAAGSFASKTAEPATRIEAPCSARGRACSTFTPPSMETSTGRAPSAGRAGSVNGLTMDRYDTISFLSDYGTTDEFVGVVKSVIRSMGNDASA